MSRKSRAFFLNVNFCDYTTKESLFMANYYNHPSGSHLTLSDRITIQSEIDSSHSVREIAKNLGKAPSTISREIKNRTKHYKPTKNTCKHRSCKEKHVCRNMDCKNKCVSCVKCTYFCPNFDEVLCPKKENHPLKLCNGCTSVHYCRSRKSLYDAEYAEHQYRENLVSSRKGFDLTEEQLKDINEKVSPLIKQGLSPYAVKQTLGSGIPISEATLRRMINDCVLDVRNIDLTDAVKRKKRNKRHAMKMEIVSVNKAGHLYSDYRKFIKGNPDVKVVQMDCVEGIKTDEKTLLTLHFPLFHLQIAVLLEHHTSKCVVEALDYIEEQIGPNQFQNLFPLILTDNGHEFTDIQQMERSVFGGKRTTIYFCEPNRSDQKAECETNHKLIRRILPKKTSFEFLTQEKVNLMMNHINNYPRESLFGKTPYWLAKSCIAPKTLEKFGISFIPSKAVKIKPDLLKK